MPNSPPVFINGSFTLHPLTGVQRYASELTLRLISLANEKAPGSAAIELLTPAKQYSGLVRRNFWEQVELLAQSFRGILFSPSTIGPWFHPRHAITIHDIRAFSSEHIESLPARTQRWQRASFRVLTKTAAVILTDSLYSQSRILETFHLRDDRVKVIYPGADHILNAPAVPATLDALGLEPGKYVLAVGSLYPHKNLTILHSINWEEFGLDLCIVGEAPSTNAKAFQQVVDEARVQPRTIHYIGRRSDGEIRSLYMNAFAYVLPSLYEGFGFPPLEAMYCGCPVLASDRTSIPEVCGEAASYFDPLSRESLGRVIAQLVDDSQLRTKMIENGYRRAREFTWDRTAREVMALLEQM